MKLLTLALVLVTGGVFAQATRSLGGVNFTVIDPVAYAFNADTGRLSAGQRFVIDGRVASISGAYLNLLDTGLNSFTLNAPMRSLSFGASVTIFVEVTRVNRLFGTADARIVRIEGAGVAAAQIQPSTGTRSLDGVQYQVITPEEYAFNADTGRLRPGQRFVMDGQVSSISGASLWLINTGLNSFRLSAPLRLDFMTNVTVFFEVTSVNSMFGMAEARVVRIETR